MKTKKFLVLLNKGDLTNVRIPWNKNHFMLPVIMETLIVLR